MEIIILLFFKITNSLYSVWKLFFQCSMPFFLILILFNSFNRNLEIIPNSMKVTESFCSSLQPCHMRLVFFLSLMFSFSLLCLFPYQNMLSKKQTSYESLPWVWLSVAVLSCFQANKLQVSGNGQKRCFEEVSSL